MPIQDCMITSVISATPDQTVSDVVELLNTHKIRWVPVLDAEKKLLGTFCTSQFVKTILPKSVSMEDGINRLSFALGMSENMAERLRTVAPQPVKDHMDKDPMVLSPETPNMEGFRMLTKYGSPLPVVGKNGELVGILSDQSAIQAIRKIEAELDLTS